MRATNSARNWGWVARLLHWAMAGLILFQIGLGVWMTNFVPDPLAQFRLTQIHKSWGFVILCLAVLRAGWRLGNRRRPGPPPGAAAWEARAAAAAHAGLYALMFVMPLSGWVMAAASPVQDLLGMENTVFGAFALPDPWVPGDEAVEAAARAVHIAGAVALALLVGLHAGAALKHHLIDRDDVLARMTFGG